MTVDETTSPGNDGARALSAEAALRDQYDLAKALAAARTPGEGLLLCLDAAIEAAGLDCGGVYMLDETTDALDLVVHRGISAVFAGEVGHLDAAIAEEMLSAPGAAMFAPYDGVSSVLSEPMRREGLRFVSLLAMRHEGRLIGCFNVASHVLDDVPPASREVLETIAAVAGQAVARLQAEAAMREREENFRSFFDSISDFLFVLDGQGRILRVNSTVVERLGYSEAELLGRHALAVHPPERHDEAARIIGEMLAGTNDACPVPLRTKDGRLIPVETRVTTGTWGGEPAIFGVSRDTSERERMLKALRESESLLDSIVDNVPAMIFVKDADDLRFVRVNCAGEELLGLSRAELIGKSDRDFFPADQAEFFARTDRTVLAEGRVVDVPEETIETREHGERLLHTTKIPLHGADGKPAYLLGIATDITEQREAERLRRIQYELGADLAMARSLRQGLTLCLHAAIEAAGLDSGGVYSVDEATGVLDLVGSTGLSPEFVQQVARFEADSPNARVIKAGQTVYAPYDHLGINVPESRKREGLRFVALVPMRHEGRVIGCLNAASHTRDDIPIVSRQALETIASVAAQGVARLQVEAALRASEERYRGIFDDSLAAIYTFDLEKRFVDSNLAGLDLLGYSREELLQLRMTDVDADPDVMLPLQADVLSGGRLVAFEHRLRRKDGRVITVLNTSRALTNAKGEVVGVLGTLLDVTELELAREQERKLQAQLDQAQRLESVGRLAGGVAHDFNNMLQVIQFHASAGLEELPGGSPLRDDLEEILRCAQRSADLTRQLLAFARRQTVSPRSLDLNVVVEDALNMLRRMIGEAIEVEWRPGAELGHVLMDPSQVDQILANLCVNARDAIGGAGRIVVETANERVDESRACLSPEIVPGDYVRLSVADSGPGVAPEVLAHIFEPFFTTKGVGEGTGLGLATVYGAVSQAGGSICVTSDPGSGARFNVYLPRVDAQTVPHPAQADADQARAGHERILVVEDEPAILRALRLVLQRQGYTVLDAPTGTAALELAESAGPIDLLITDVVMPGMDGPELARQLTLRRPGLRRLFISGYPADVITRYQGADEDFRIIEKPFTTEQLLAAVREALGTHS